MDIVKFSGGKMLTIKDFKKGDKVYILTRNLGRNTKPSVREKEVTTVGRMYVSIGDGEWKQKFMNYDSEYLYEKASFGESDLLFKTMKDAEEYIEKCSLALWLGCISVGRAETYSVEQLRKVKEILVN